MVAVAFSAPQNFDSTSIKTWLQETASTYPKSDRDAFENTVLALAPWYEPHLTTEGEGWLGRVLGTFAVLIGLKMDRDTLIAALMLGLPYCLPKERLEDWRTGRLFHSNAALVDLVQGVHDMRAIETLHEKSKGGGALQAETLRKMLLAMVQDFRVVLIKLAERTQALRYAVSKEVLMNDGERLTLAERILHLFAPLANRMGIWQLKWELEDLSLRLIDDNAYKTIAKGLDERREDRKTYISDIIQTLNDDLKALNIQGEVTGRPKHIYSIYKKMSRKNVPLEEIYDIRAVRVLVNTLEECYTVLSRVHDRWPAILGEFDDYIAKPKANNYQSIHTAVWCDGHKTLEIQIRTYQMHQDSEHGVAAHWRYKEGGGSFSSQFEEKIGWLRQVMEWRGDESTEADWLTQLKTPLFQDTIYVLSPEGKVVDLPQNATPVDFAYRIHTELGHRCRGATVDGKWVPLDTPLQNGQSVSITTQKDGQPSMDWLAFLKTNHAKSKVRQWFRQHQAQQEHLNAEKHETTKILHPAPATPDERTAFPLPSATQSPDPVSSSGSISGVSNLLTTLARCCKPAPGDSIYGYVTKGKGIVIHRKSCPNFKRLLTTHPERTIPVDWATLQQNHFVLTLQIEAQDRPGLLRDLTEILVELKINVVGVNTLSRGQHALMQFHVEVTRGQAPDWLMDKLRKIPGVHTVFRPTN
ncbi:MAG: HD domain-containing protein [Pseudomonadota bacterium]